MKKAWSISLSFVTIGPSQIDVFLLLLLPEQDKSVAWCVDDAFVLLGDADVILVHYSNTSQFLSLFIYTVYLEGSISVDLGVVLFIYFLVFLISYIINPPIIAISASITTHDPDMSRFTYPSPKGR